MKDIKLIILFTIFFFIFIFNIFVSKIYAQQKFSLIITYDFDDYNNDIFWSSPDYKGTYYFTHFSIFIQKNWNFIFLSSKLTLKFYYPLFDKSLDLKWFNPSISFLLGVYSKNNSNIIVKAGFFLTFSYLDVQLNNSIILKKDFMLGEGLLFSFGIRLTEKINLILNISFQSDLTSYFGEYFVFLDSIDTGIGLEFYL